MSKRKKFFRSWQFWVLTFSVLALTTILTGIWAYRHFKVAEAEKDANFCVALLETVKKNREMPFSDSLERRLDTAIVRMEQKTRTR